MSLLPEPMLHCCRGQHPELGNVAPPPVEGLKKDSSAVLCAFEKALAINKVRASALPRYDLDGPWSVGGG